MTKSVGWFKFSSRHSDKYVCRYRLHEIRLTYDFKSRTAAYSVYSGPKHLQFDSFDGAKITVAEAKKRALAWVDTLTSGQTIPGMLTT